MCESIQKIFKRSIRKIIICDQGASNIFTAIGYIENYISTVFHLDASMNI